MKISSQNFRLDQVFQTLMTEFKVWSLSPTLVWSNIFFPWVLDIKSIIKLEKSGPNFLEHDSFKKFRVQLQKFLKSSCLKTSSPKVWDVQLWTHHSWLLSPLPQLWSRFHDQMISFIKIPSFNSVLWSIFHQVTQDGWGHGRQTFLWPKTLLPKPKPIQTTRPTFFSFRQDILSW